MLKRIGTAAVGIPLIFLAVYLGSPWLTAVVGTVAFFALREFLLLQGFGGRSATLWSLPVTGACYANIATGLLPWQSYILVYFMVVAAVGMVLFPRLGVVRAMALGWGGIYIPLLMSSLVLLREMEQGFALTLLVLALTWGTDTGAFFAGSFWGKKKLAPSLSPNKTWAGAWGGLVMGVIIGLSYGIITNANLVQFGLWGAVASTMGQIGDLCESAIKRKAGVKDSGSLLPGHGGFFDRIDSLLFTAAVSYIFFGMVI